MGKLPGTLFMLGVVCHHVHEELQGLRLGDGAVRLTKQLHNCRSTAGLKEGVEQALAGESCRQALDCQGGWVVEVEGLILAFLIHLEDVPANNKHDVTLLDSTSRLAPANNNRVSFKS
jgi:hypothetical protein